MYTFAFVFAGAFLIDSIFHIRAIVKAREALRRITKVILMPLLAVAFYFAWTSFSIQPLPWKLIGALIFGCIGDICLLDHHGAGFPWGLSAFAIGHVLYIAQLFSLVVMPAWWMLVLMAFLYGAGTFIQFQKLYPYLPKRYVAAILLYMLLLCIFSATAASAMLTNFHPGFLIIAVGTLLFMLSDTMLSFEIFKENTKNGNLKVMISYMAAQACIVAGFFLWMK